MVASHHRLRRLFQIAVMFGDFLRIERHIGVQVNAQNVAGRLFIRALDANAAVNTLRAQNRRVNIIRVGSRSA